MAQPAIAAPPVFNGSINAPSGGYVQPVGTIDATRYGADPTDTTDSTTALNNAASAAITANKCLLVRPGTYKITGTVTVLGSHACAIMWGVTFKWGTTAPGVLTPMVLFGATSGTTFSEYQDILGLTVDGNNTANLIGMEFGNVEQGFFSGLAANNFNATADCAFYLYGYSASGLHNTFGNDFVGLSATSVKNGIDFVGDTVSGGFVTDNDFHGVHLYGVINDVMNFYANCDNNHFYGVYGAEDSASVSPGIVFGNSISADSDGDGEIIDGLSMDMGTAGSYALTFNESAGNVIRGEVNLSAAQINNLAPTYSTFRVDSLGNGGAIVGNGSAVSVTDQFSNVTVNAAGIATSGANYGSELSKWNYSIWSGSAPTTYYWAQYSDNGGNLFFHNSQNITNIIFEPGGQINALEVISGGTAAAGSNLGDVTTARGATSGYVFFGNGTTAQTSYIGASSNAISLIPTTSTASTKVTINSSASVIASGYLSGGAHNNCASTSGWPCVFTWSVTMTAGAGTTTTTVPATSVCFLTPNVTPVLSSTNVASEWPTLSSTTLTIHVQDMLGSSTATITGNGTCL